MSKFNTGLKYLLKQGLSELAFYGDLCINVEKIVGRNDFSDQFRKIGIRYKRIGYMYNVNVMRHTACLVFNSITVNTFAALFNCTLAGRASRLNDGSRLKTFDEIGCGLMICLWLGLPGFCCSSVSVLVLLLSTHLV